MNPLMLWVAAAFAGGILLGRSASPSLPATLALAGLALLLGAVLTRGRMPWPALGFSLVGFVAAGAVAWLLFPLRIPSHHIARLVEGGVIDETEPVRLEGWIASPPLLRAPSVRFDLQVTAAEGSDYSTSAQGKVRLWVSLNPGLARDDVPNPLELRYGDAIRAWVTLRRPRNFHNPGSFDYRRRMEQIDDLYLTASLRRGHHIEKVGSGRGNRWIRTATVVRKKLLDGIDRIYAPWAAEGRWGAMLKALLLGDRTSLDRKMVEGFQKSGLYHLLVISGLHLGLLALIGHGILKLIRLSEAHRIPVVIGFLSLYCLLIDLRAPTLRALLMISVYLVGRLLLRQHSLLNAIGIAGLALMLIRPSWLFETGFQLSFAAVLLIAGLVVPLLQATTELYRRGLNQLENVELDGRLAPRVAQMRLDLRAAVGWLGRQLGGPRQSLQVARSILLWPLRGGFWVVNTVIFTAILQIGLLLPMVESFHRVSLVGIGLNAVAIPLLALILALGLPCSFLAITWPAGAEPLAELLAALLSLLSGLTEISGLPGWMAYRVPSPPMWVALGFGISWVAVGLAICLRRGVAFAGPVAAGFALLIAVSPFRADLAPDELEVTALDVGYGDAIFLSLPDRSTMLVDGGGIEGRGRSANRMDVGEEVVSRYLWSRRIRKIDVVALTAPREHHVGGLASVLKNFDVGEVWVGGSGSHPAYRTLLALARERGIPIRHCNAGERFDRGGVRIRVLWPQESESGEDGSLILRLEWKDTGVLLSSDIREPVERRLLAGLESKPLEILKVARHGARVASGEEFLAHLRPSIALITAGGSRPYGLPSSDTLSRLRRMGAEIYRTDRDGAVTLRSNGDSLRVTTFRSRLSGRPRLFPVRPERPLRVRAAG